MHFVPTQGMGPNLRLDINLMGYCCPPNLISGLVIAISFQM